MMTREDGEDQVLTCYGGPGWLCPHRSNSTLDLLGCTWLEEDMCWAVPPSMGAPSMRLCDYI